VRDPESGTGTVFEVTLPGGKSEPRNPKLETNPQEETEMTNAST
jgi:hypothetical protein